MDNYEKFKKDVFALTGIDLDAYKEKQMRRRIETLIGKNKITSYDEYVKLIKTNKTKFEEFINYLTINVSEFYRNPDQWDLMDKEIIPDLISKFGNNLKIWSAACSTGDEPYSLVMLLSKHIPLNQIKIYATDIDKQVMAQAQVGLYNEKSLVGVPAEFKAKYFKKVGTSYQISDEIKSRVEFKQANLLTDNYPSNYDFIVCRNVLIYFTDEAKTDVYAKFAKSLKPGGVLFIGSTEQIIGYKELGYKRRSSFFFEKEA